MVRRTREGVLALIDVVKTCALGNVPVRGHRDDGRIDPSGVRPKENDGNFREFIRLLLRRGDLKLREYLENVPGNASYISKTSQNEILDDISRLLLLDVVKKLKERGLWCISADETTDRANREQLVIVARSVSQEKEPLPQGGTGYVVHEDPIAVLDCFVEMVALLEEGEAPRMSGENIARVAIDRMCTLGVPIPRAVGAVRFIYIIYSLLEIIRTAGKKPQT